MEHSKRKRSRVACKPCRERKRKCDGSDPCHTCTDWAYECSYETRPRKAQATEPTTPESPTRNQSLQPSTLGPETVESGQSELAGRLEANSGAAFVRKLGLKVDPTRALKLHLFGWNIGSRKLSTSLEATLPLPVVDITSIEHMKRLAQVYFEKVDPCYGFIDRREFFERLDDRWKSPGAPDLYDSVLAGVTALGCMFSQRNATVTELHLVRSARSALDGHHVTGVPSRHLVCGWMLRTIYLRMTDSPHSTWLASSTVMHLLEASGLHPESPSVLLRNAQSDPDLERRIAGVAHHLNVWTSFDLGLSRVSFQKSDMPLLPVSRPGDYTAELLALLPVSLSLDPMRTKDEKDLTSTLSEILEGSHTQPPSVLAQCNLVLCILRRIHTQNLDISAGLVEHVLALLKKGLGCARAMLMDCCPWHHVANVPFQIISVLLVMDTRSSLAMLPEAIQTLNLVASTYDTENMREAYGAAYVLVLLHQQRRKDDIAIFGEALNIQQPERQHLATPPQIDVSARESSWLGALVADLPGLQRVDFGQFLYADMTDWFSLPGNSG